MPIPQTARELAAALDNSDGLADGKFHGVPIVVGDSSPYVPLFSTYTMSACTCFDPHVLAPHIWYPLIYTPLQQALREARLPTMRACMPAR